MSVLFILLFFANAWLFFRLFNRNAPERHALESVFFALVPVIVLVSWFGLLFAELGVFSLLSLNIVLLLSAGGVLFYLKRKALAILQRPVLRLDRYEVAALVVLLLAGMLSETYWLLLLGVVVLAIGLLSGRL